MSAFSFRESIASLESSLSADAFRKVQVALSLLHYEHGLEVSEKSYLLALTMCLGELEPSMPKEVAARYGFSNRLSDHDLVQREMQKGFQVFSLGDIEAELSKISS